MSYLLRPATRPCDGTCGADDFHTAHFTRGYRFRLKVYGFLRALGVVR